MCMFINEKHRVASYTHERLLKWPCGHPSKKTCASVGLKYVLSVITHSRRVAEVFRRVFVLTGIFIKGGY